MSAAAPSPARPVKISRSGCAVVVSMHGVLDNGTIPHLRHALVDLIDGQGNLAVCIDLREAVEVESGVVDLITDAHRRLDEKGGRLLIVGAPAPLQSVL